MSMTFMGIDPGEKGGIVWLDNDGFLLKCEKMPETMAGIYAHLLPEPQFDKIVCFIEDVGNGMPGQSSKSTATFARHNGHLEMALYAHGISVIKVSPAKWQKHFNLLSKKGESKTSHKNRIKSWAQQRFPGIKVTLALADALAIASYGFETRR